MTGVYGRVSAADGQDQQCDVIGEYAAAMTLDRTQQHSLQVHRRCTGVRPQHRDDAFFAKLIAVDGCGVEDTVGVQDQGVVIGQIDLSVGVIAVLKQPSGSPAVSSRITSPPALITIGA